MPIASERTIKKSNALTSATLPEALTTIGNNLFTNNNLSSFTFSENVTTIGIGAFQGNELTTVTFGENLSTIEAGAFADNDLTVVNIPDSVTLIGNVAFNNNPLTDVYSFAITPPVITTGAGDTFATDRSNIHLHIPTGTMGPYVTDAGALWTGFNPVTEDILNTLDFTLEPQVKIISTPENIHIMVSGNDNFKGYTLYGISGKKVVSGISNQINTHHYAKGIYVLKLDFDQASVTKKVILY